MRDFERFIVYPLLALLAWASFSAHASPIVVDGVTAKVVTAEHYRLVDGARRERGRLETSGEGVCALQLLADDGTTRAALSLGGDGGASLMLLDNMGMGRVVLILFASGMSGLEFRDGTGRERLGAIVSPDGTPTFRLMDRAGGGRVEMGVTQDGDGSVRIGGGDDTTLWSSPAMR